jgi:hypothetical protein
MQIQKTTFLYIVCPLMLIGAIACTTPLVSTQPTATAPHSVSEVFETKITANDGAGEDWFGLSVSISGDFAIVGSMYDDGEVTYDFGSAYIFHRSGGRWIQQTKLRPADIKSGDKFGRGVSVSDENAAVVTETGVLYIYHRKATRWVQEAKFVPRAPASGHRLGPNVAISGNAVIVEASDEGAAYIFRRQGGGWVEDAKLTTDESPIDSFFGQSVSISGDYAAVGAHYSDDYGSESGATYIFRRTERGWVQDAKLTAGDAQAGGWFGRSVSIDDDSVIIGAFSTNNRGVARGAAYIFQRTDDGWIERAKLISDGSYLEDLFGSSVGISGDTAVVGAMHDEDKGVEAGAIYLFKRIEGQWKLSRKVSASDGQKNDVFGKSVSISGNYAITGSHWDDDAGEKSGAAYIYNTIFE